jgi:hypothetical protein
LKGAPFLNAFFWSCKVHLALFVHTGWSKSKKDML